MPGPVRTREHFTVQCPRSGLEGQNNKVQGDSWSTLDDLQTPRFFLRKTVICIGFHSVRESHRGSRVSGDRRAGRRANGSHRSRQHRAFANSALWIICDGFQRSAKKASKKSAITQPTRLQRHEIRICAIFLLIVNTRSNQNARSVADR
jgi:hypothetical protein